MSLLSNSARGGRLLTLAATGIAVALLSTAGSRYQRNHRLMRQLARALDARPPQPNVVRALLEEGANPDTCSTTGKTLLMVAADTGDEELLSRALAGRHEINARDQYGTSALEYAVNACKEFQEDPEHLLVVKTLVERGADPTAVTMVSGGPLFTAAAHGNTEVVRVLLAAGARVNDQDHQGRTPLHMASLNGQVRIVKLLLAAGANPYLRGREGVTVADEVRLQAAGKLKALRQAGASKRDLAEAERVTRALLQILR